MVGHRRSNSVLVGVLGATALGLWAGPAAASNGTKPRIAVDWTNAACLTIVDRSVETNLHLTYTVVQDDTELTPDEVDDSRTHQFFGLCRSRDPQSFLPRWITQADIDRAAAVGAAPPMIDPEDVFETSTEWADCWYRINGDDERVPITMAAAAAGVDWDTSTVPAGTYVVEGYTWEPALNIWSGRTGVVKVVDGPSLASSGPALSVSNTEEVLHKNEPVTITGCVSAMEGSTITAYWGLAELDVSWQAFIEDDPVSGDSFALEFSPPEELTGEAAMIRVDITDPMGRSYTNYMRELVIVLGTEGPGSCMDEGGFIGGAGCGDSGTGADTSGGAASSGGDETAGSAGTSAGPGGQDGDGGGGGKGCGCQASHGDTDPATPAGAGLLLLGLLGLRRRSSL